MSTQRRTDSPNGGRTFIAAIIGLVAAVATIVTPLGVWAKYEVADTEKFVAATTPLAADPAVQEALTADITKALPDALTNLGGGLVDVVVSRTMSKVMSTPAFERAWTSSLREAHTQAVSVLDGEPASNDGVIALQLGPLINSVKDSLVESGMPAADLIPEVQAQLTVAPTETFVKAKDGYGLAMLVGTWGPLVSLGLWAIAILVAPRRGAATGWFGFSLLFSAGFTFVALNLGGAAVQSSLTGTQLPKSVITAAYEALSSAAQGGLLILAVAGVVVTIAGVIIGRRLR